MKAFAHAACFNKWFSCSVPHTKCSVSSLLEFQEKRANHCDVCVGILHSSSNHKNVVRSSYFHRRIKSRSCKKPRKSAFCLNLSLYKAEPFLSTLQNMGIKFLQGVENFQHSDVLFVQAADKFLHAAKIHFLQL